MFIFLSHITSHLELIKFIGELLNLHFALFDNVIVNKRFLSVLFRKKLSMQQFLYVLRSSNFLFSFPGPLFLYMLPPNWSMFLQFNGGQFNLFFSESYFISKICSTLFSQPLNSICLTIRLQVLVFMSISREYCWFLGLTPQLGNYCAKGLVPSPFSSTVSLYQISLLFP